MRVALYWDWIESEAALIGTDGCSKVTGAFRRCCLAHDLAYYHGKDPVTAYTSYRNGLVQPWADATTITRAEADASFRRCIQSQSAFGFWSLYAIQRWIGVRLFGGRAWSRHRAADPHLEPAA